MKDDSLSLAEVQAELERIRAELQQKRAEIELLEADEAQTLAFAARFQAILRNKESAPARRTSKSSSSAVRSKSRARRPVTAPPKPLTVEQRAIHELEKAGKFLGMPELVQLMEASGYKAGGGGKVYDQVYGSLHHALRKKDARLVRENAKWGLREWLPSG